MVAKTSELLPEPETPVKTVSRRFGSSTLMSWRLFSRAPCTRIRSCVSATCPSGDCEPVLVVLLILSPSVGRAAALGVASLDLTRVEQYVWFYFVRAAAATDRGPPVCRVAPGGTSPGPVLIGP